MFLASLPLGFAAILVAAVAGGVFGLQYRIMKKYTVENSSLLSLFFATIVVPTIAVMFIIPDWTSVIAEAGFNPGKRFKRIGIPDEFPDEYGSQDSLMDHYSINAQRVTELVLELSDPGSPMSPAQKIIRA